MDQEYDNSYLLQLGTKILIEKSPFSKLLGLKMESIEDGVVYLRFEMNDDLLGSVDVGSLHGGVISSSFDMAGGLVVFLSSFKKIKQTFKDSRIKKINRFDTIDLRVDYLHPACGRYFFVKAWILRTGSKVVFIRMELLNDEDKLIAIGTGTYLAG